VLRAFWHEAVPTHPDRPWRGELSHRERARYPPCTAISMSERAAGLFSHVACFDAARSSADGPRCSLMIWRSLVFSHCLTDCRVELTLASASPQTRIKNSLDDLDGIGFVLAAS
jgi:hypothetical protein